jgi:hypothetical protein
MLPSQVRRLHPVCGPRLPCNTRGFIFAMVQHLRDDNQVSLMAKALGTGATTRSVLYLSLYGNTVSYLLCWQEPFPKDIV